MKPLFYLLGSTVMVSPIAPQQCATVGVGVTYHGTYGDYTVKRTVEQGKPAAWDVLIDADGKQIVPFK